MDSVRFDALTRSLSQPRSRRANVSALLGGGLGLFGVSAVHHAAAKNCKKIKDKKKRKKCLANAKPADNTTTTGCAAGTRDCNGACIAQSGCCGNGECAHLSAVCRRGECTASHECVQVQENGGSCIEDNASGCAIAPFNCSCVAGACV